MRINMQYSGSGQLGDALSMLVVSIEQSTPLVRGLAWIHDSASRKAPLTNRCCVLYTFLLAKMLKECKNKINSSDVPLRVAMDVPAAGALGGSIDLGAE